MSRGRISIPWIGCDRPGCAGYYEGFAGQSMPGLKKVAKEDGWLVSNHADYCSASCKPDSAGCPREQS